MRCLRACMGLGLGSVLLVAGAGSSVPVWTHANSFSWSEIHVRGGSLEVHLRCQVLSLAEVIEPFDPEGDGHAEDGEIEANASAIAKYVAAHYRVSAEGPGDSPRVALGVAESLVTEAPLDLDPMNAVSEWVDIRLTLEEADFDVESVVVETSLFLETSPEHRDSSVIVWNGEESGSWQFGPGSLGHAFEPAEGVLARNQPAVERFARTGLGQPFSGGPDVALLGVLLVLAAARTRLSPWVSGGTFLGALVVGSVLAPTLALSTSQVRFVELTVPLALAYVALDDLLHKDGRTRVLEGLVFGLVVGARGVIELAPMLRLEASPGPGVSGFVLGLGGTLTVLMLVAGSVLRQPSSADSADPRPSDLEGDVNGGLVGAHGRLGARRIIALVALALGAWAFLGATWLA